MEIEEKIKDYKLIDYYMDLEILGLDNKRILYDRNEKKIIGEYNFRREKIEED